MASKAANKMESDINKNNLNDSVRFHRGIKDFLHGSGCSLHFFYKQTDFWRKNPFADLVPGLGIRSFQKNVTIFAFFSVLYKRMERSLRSFPFFIKEQNVFCVLLRSL